MAPQDAPTRLLQASRPGAAGIQSLSVGDALTFQGIDYVVEGIATSFTDGQTSRLAHLTPSGGGSGEPWLSISPGGFELAWLHAIAPAVSPGATQIARDGVVLPLISAQSASVAVQSISGAAADVLVRSWTYRAGNLLEVIEQWPDGTIRAYVGQPIESKEIEVWPAVRKSEAEGKPLPG